MQRPVAEIWSLTPAEVHRLLDAERERLEDEQDRMTTAAYIGAKVMRAKRAPKLKEVLIGDAVDQGPAYKTPKKIQEEQQYLKETGLWE